MQTFFSKFSVRVFVLIVFLFLVLFANFIGNKEGSVSRKIAKSNAYLYKNQAVGIGKINLKVFYAVPSDKRDSVYANFSVVVKRALDDAVRFHRSQFRESSYLTYDIYPEPLVMNENSLFYNTIDTNHGNPEGLKNLIPEIEKKMADFLEHDTDEFLVIGIVYEGVGASGADGAFLIAREFLSEEQYQPVAATLLYHEFGHALGLPDQYDIATGAPYSNDIMGGGREKPIEVNYLDKELLREMGVVN